MIFYNNNHFIFKRILQLYTTYKRKKLMVLFLEPEALVH